MILRGCLLLLFIAEEMYSLYTIAAGRFILCFASSVFLSSFWKIFTLLTMDGSKQLWHDAKFWSIGSIMCYNKTEIMLYLFQVGAIAPQSLEPLVQSIHDCLSSSDWATRKAAADTLSVLAFHSSSLVTERANATLMVLEACRFDKVYFCIYLGKVIQFWRTIPFGRRSTGINNGAKEKSKAW